MFNSIKKLAFILWIIACSHFKTLAQNETSKWASCYSGIDFMQNPPVTFSSSTPNGFGVPASICDENGNLLFYTNGSVIFNQANVPMANGSGILGQNGAEGYRALILKKPNSANLYYVFTLNGYASSVNNGGGFRYSIVDMNLAAGMGSVTTKNVLIWDPPSTPFLTGENLTGTQHCNGNDYWIVTHERGTAVFRSYLLSATGLNTTAITSTVGDVMGASARQIKISPTGKKIALCLNWGIYAPSSINVHDFDNSTGAVSSNSMALFVPTISPGGCEFSPDGTKLYGSVSTNGAASTSTSMGIYQWDLCAGNAQAVNASSVFLSQGSILTNSSIAGYLGHQLARNGKIYIYLDSDTCMAVVNNPNANGAACNFVRNGYPKGLKINNFITYNLRSYSPCTYTAQCQQVQFTSPTGPQSLACAALNNPLVSTYWDFGDPASGANNISYAYLGSHYYTATGTYTTKLALNYPCYTDTVRQVITVSSPNPTFTVLSPTAICRGDRAVFTASSSAAYNYTWSGGVQGNSIAVTPSVSTAYTVKVTNTVTGCSSIKTINLSVNKCLGLINTSEMIDHVSVYPNPSNGLLMIETEQVIDIKILDQLGKIILSKHISENSCTLNLSTLSNGIYFIQVNHGKKTKTLKWLKTD